MNESTDPAVFALDGCQDVIDVYLQCRQSIRATADSEKNSTYHHEMDHGYARRTRSPDGTLRAHASSDLQDQAFLYDRLARSQTPEATTDGGARELTAAAVEAALVQGATYARATWRSAREDVLVLTASGAHTDRRYRRELTVRCHVGTALPVKGYARWASGAVRHPETAEAAEVGVRAAQDALARAASAPAPSGRFDILLQPAWSGVFFHETIGHVLEADGPATSVLERLRGRQISPVEFDVADDPTLADGFGSYGVDDEGTATAPTALVTRGVVTALLSDRLSSARLGIPLSGNGRRATWRDLPQARMSNLVVSASYASASDLSSIASGRRPIVVVDALRGGAMNPAGSFQFTAASGQILRGAARIPIRDFVVAGDIVEALASVTAVGDDVALSHGRCGKSGHEVCVGVAGPSVLVADLEVRGG